MANSNHRPRPPLLAATSCRAGFLWRGNTVKLGSAVVNLGENWDNMGLARRTFVQPSSNDHTGGRPRLDSLPRVRDIWSASAGLRYLTLDI